MSSGALLSQAGGNAVGHAGGHAGGARIGPNAITRVAEALCQRRGEAAAQRVFSRAGLLRHLLQPPEAMVDEAEVTRLHIALRDSLGDHEAELLSRDAGRATADYLLARRIPRAVQWLLMMLPARLAARVLLQAMSRHAWTFAGSGRFSATAAGSRVVLTLQGNPLCRGQTLDDPGCSYYAATFERLFQVLVHAKARVTETDCEACGAAQCRFEVDWPHRS